jgi:uncharacterized protein
VKFLLLLPALLLAAPAHAALRLPSQPNSGQHVVDLADLITPEDEARIQETAQQLWEQEQVQLVVASIDSMARYGGARMTIDDFASSLYTHWAMEGSAGREADESRNILLLVSRLDRKARIHLGEGWGYTKDPESWDIMQKHLVPSFKRDKHSSGLAFGAVALDHMVRGLNPPRPPLTLDDIMLFGGGGALLLFTVISMVRTGTSGWAWAFWGVVFSILWFIITLLFTPRRGYRNDWGSSYSSGSSWSGGSSGSSGSSSSSSGGGATGSW